MQETSSSRSENNDVTSTSAFDDINKNVEEKLPESEKSPPETKPELPDVTSDTPSGKKVNRKLSKGREMKKTKTKKDETDDPESSDSNSGRRPFGGLDWMYISVAIILGLSLVAVLLYFTVLKGILDKRRPEVVLTDGTTLLLGDVDLTTVSGLIDVVESTSTATRIPLTDMLRGLTRPPRDSTTLPVTTTETGPGR